MSYLLNVFIVLVLLLVMYWMLFGVASLAVYVHGCRWFLSVALECCFCVCMCVLLCFYCVNHWLSVCIVYWLCVGCLLVNDWCSRGLYLNCMGLVVLLVCTCYVLALIGL